MDFDPKQFDKIVDRSQIWSVKWDPEYMIDRFDRSDLLPFNHAEMDFECPYPVIEAIKERASHGIYGYTLVKTEYYDEIINWFRTRHNVIYQREDLLYHTGVIASYRQVINFFTQPKDKVAVFTPVYGALSEAVEEYNRNLITVPLLLEDNTYSIDFDLLEKVFESHTIKMFSLCNPHNPVGRVWTKRELKKLEDICLSYNTLIVSDDIHCDLIAKNYKYIPISSLSEECAMSSIILTSMTKTFNLSGLRVSNIHIQNPELREDFYKLRNKKFVYEPSVFGIIALMVAYSKCGPWVDILTNYLDENYQFIKNFINENKLAINLIHREGTPTAWFDFRRIALPYDMIFNFIVHKAGLILVDGNYYTANGEGFQRMSIGFPRSRIQLAMDKLKKALIEPT